MSGYQSFLLCLSGYILFLVATGYYFCSRQTTIREFMLAGRRAGAVSIGFSAAASWLTAGGVLAVTGFFMMLGMGSIWGFVAPNIIALLIISLFVRKIRSIPAMTQPELLEIRYGSFLRTPVALIIIVVMVLFIVADIKGFAMVLEILYGVDTIEAAVIVGLSVAVYVSLGGLSAVMATDAVQYLFLAGFVVLMVSLVTGTADQISGESFINTARKIDGSWWNPFSVGLPMALIFSAAIIPGWVTEQDPWQKVWAARDAGSARRGMIGGSILVTFVFIGCGVIAIGLNSIYPDIAAEGFPAGMAQAESALLHFIRQHVSSDLLVSLCAVALATAAMSCADTFAASAGSCISRDIYQRLLHPSATMKQMVLVNRFSIVLIISSATFLSFFINSIIEAIHIATFIASSSYFFVLIGGLFWKGATPVGAAMSLITGFICQCFFVVLDLVAKSGDNPFLLESIHPLLTGHGVIVAMALSGIVYVGVSLVTRKSEQYRLALFFTDSNTFLVDPIANISQDDTMVVDEKLIREQTGNMVRYQLCLSLPGRLQWRQFVQIMDSSYSYWRSLSGPDSIVRHTRRDILTCVSIVCGASMSEIRLEIEGHKNDDLELKDEIVCAGQEALRVLSGRS